MLPVLEGRTFSLQDFYSELMELKACYKVLFKFYIHKYGLALFFVAQLTGFPIHIRYSDLQQLLITVERTGIHLCENKNVEYSLAVHVHFYPNDVLSVWVYVAYMVPKIF